MRPHDAIVVLVMALATAAGCGAGSAHSPTDGGMDGATTDGGTLAALVAALEADDFLVQQGAFEVQDLSSCCDLGASCYAGNPASPYAALRVPPALEQTVPNPMQNANEESVTFRLGADEAVVYVGRTPPRARYFGYTPYLYDRDDGGIRQTVFASLSETLNNAVIAVDGDDVFDQPVAVIAAADRGVDGRVRSALGAAGFSAAATNTAVFDPTVSRFGVDDAGDTFAVVFRVALFDDPAEGEAFLADPPGDVLRVSPRSHPAADPFPAPPVRPKDTSNSELALASAVDALEAALIAEYPAYVGSSVAVNDITPDPAVCIDRLQNCNADNRDTIYPATGVLLPFLGTDDFYVAYGVNHEATGKATYSSVAVTAVAHLAGVATATSADYAGSAGDELVGNPDASRLYAWKLARDCGADPACTPIPDEGCPTGVEAGAAALLLFRAYLEPSTNTAPDAATLVPERVLHFAP
jgi:hypothetical protein